MPRPGEATTRNHSANTLDDPNSQRGETLHLDDPRVFVDENGKASSVRLRKVRSAADEGTRPEI